jgi:diadenosine tetraphosphate (Ap4A) HIT family hydrolase
MPEEGARRPAGWVPREQWDALVRGEGCVLCADLAADVQANRHIITVADLGVSRLWLAANQSVPGYCILVSRKHVREPYELPRDEQLAYFEDLMRAARALERVFHPVKLNYEILGNLVPHLHCHLKPRYYGDPAPGRPIEVDERVVRLSPEDYQRRAAAIRAAL